MKQEKITWNTTIEDFLDTVGFYDGKRNPEGLSCRCYMAVASMGYRKIWDTVFYDKLSYLKNIADLGLMLYMRNFGPKSLEELNKALNKYRLEKLVNNKKRDPDAYEKIKKLKENSLIKNVLILLSKGIKI